MVATTANFIYETILEVCTAAGFRIYLSTKLGATIAYTYYDKFYVQTFKRDRLIIQRSCDGWNVSSFEIEINKELDDPRYDPKHDVMRVFRKVFKERRDILGRVHKVLYK